MQFYLLWHCISEPTIPKKGYKLNIKKEYNIKYKEVKFSLLTSYPLELLYFTNVFFLFLRWEFYHQWSEYTI